MTRNYRAANIDRVREYDRKRAKLAHRREHARRVLKEWRRRYPDKARRYRAENPEKYAAHTAVGNAIRDGLLQKRPTCEQCHRGGRIEAHHDDYSKPLEVRWLCPPCHDEADKQRRAA
jgi:ribosomal protein S27AE